MYMALNTSNQLTRYFAYQLSAHADTHIFRQSFSQANGSIQDGLENRLGYQNSPGEQINLTPFQDAACF